MEDDLISKGCRIESEVSDALCSRFDGYNVELTAVERG